MKKTIYVNYFVQLLSLIVNFVYSLVIVRQLGATGYGDYAVFYNTLAFTILFLGFNLPSVIIFFITNKIVNSLKLLNSSILFIFLVTIVLVLTLFQSQQLGLSRFIFPAGYNKPIWIFFFATQFFLLLTSQCLSAFLNAHKIFIPVTVFALFCNITLLVFWLLVRFNFIQFSISSFDLIWWINILINFFIVCYYVYLIRARISVVSLGKFLNRDEISTLKNFTIIVYLCNAIQFLNYRMDLYFINQYCDKKEVGVYALALNLSQLVWVLPNVISSILLNYFEVNRKEKAIALATKYGSLSFYFSFVSAALLSLIYYFALPRVYGHEFNETFSLCLILFLGTVPFALSIIIANLNSGIGFVKLNLYATVFICLLGLTLDFLVIPVYGPGGAAWVKVILSIAGLIFQIIFGKIFYNLPWTNFFQFYNPRSLFQLKSKPE